MKKRIALLLALALVLGAAPALAAEAAKPVILVVSFGTSYNDSREATIGTVEQKIAAAFPEYEVRRAFTSQIIIDKLASRDGLAIDNVDQAMQRLAADGVKTLVVQPTHVMNGFEYEEMMAAIAPYAAQFDSIAYGKPLLTSVEDYFQLVEEIGAELPQAQSGEIFALMGHGTEHYANATYAALDYAFKDAGRDDVFVGTVEGYPDLDAVLRRAKESGAAKVTLLPLMIVAGDHAANDMAGDEEGSWKLAFKGEGYEVDCLLKGLGEYAGVQDHFVRHVQAAIAGAGEEAR